MNNKFIIANIIMPLRINQDGTFTTMNDNVEISFTNFEGDVLDKKKNDDDYLQSCQLNELISKMISEGQTVLQSELLHTKIVPNHQSFKYRKMLHPEKQRKNSRFTRRLSK
jgi:hypothetical protein